MHQQAAHSIIKRAAGVHLTKEQDATFRRVVDGGDQGTDAAILVTTALALP
jgi:hypothetical protein